MRIGIGIIAYNVGKELNQLICSVLADGKHEVQVFLCQHSDSQRTLRGIAHSTRPVLSYVPLVNSSSTSGSVMYGVESRHA